MNCEEEVTLLKERNRRVEADKAWEVSVFRKSLVALLTYVVTALVFYIIGVDKYLLSAFVPTVGYLLSIQTIPLVKRWWIKKYYEK